MRHPILLLLALLSAGCAAQAADPPLRRYLYVSSPDAAQPDTNAARGILVFDIDAGHKFVRRINVDFKEGLRGFCGSVKRHRSKSTRLNSSHGGISRMPSSA